MGRLGAKTEVQPFWNIEDMKAVSDWFLDHEMWHHYTTFCIGLQLGRRVGDTLNFKWSDFYHKNGSSKYSVKLQEQKTDKFTELKITRALLDVLEFYAGKIGKTIPDVYGEYLFPSRLKEQYTSHKSWYNQFDTDNVDQNFIIQKWCCDILQSDKDSDYDKVMKSWEQSHRKSWSEKQDANMNKVLISWLRKEELGRALGSQAAAYRKAFKQAVSEVGIPYPVSTHSTRKSFGYWQMQLHPNDPTNLDILQQIFEHSDRLTTAKYIGLTQEKIDKYVDDFANFFTIMRSGKNYVVPNTPVMTVRTHDLMEAVQKAFIAGKSNSDNQDLEAQMKIINKIISEIEKLN